MPRRERAPSESDRDAAQGPVRPRVVASACLGFDACRYDGEVVPSPFVMALSAHVDLVHTCPEVAIGLGTPRAPIQIERRRHEEILFQPGTERDLTETMRAWAGKWLSGVHDVDGFVLKSRSPSCGVYDTRRIPTGRGPGLFAAAVLERFPAAAIEDERRLDDARLRRRFLTRIFTTAAFRAVRRESTSAALLAFHAEHLRLLMAAAPTRSYARALQRIVANRDTRALAEVLDDYESELRSLLVRTG